ncbi:MAG TPA: hypothetical protein VH333_20540 [Pseudonocardiaceae bacterium]|jgi:hypothetical protein|nr:hypothetical protein [Pseudonocardiaceae bacterium]
MDRRRYDDDDEERPPEDLTAWLAAGLRRVEALAWRRWNFTLDDATKWRRAGVPEALLAAQWQAAAVRPDTVRGWLDAKIGPGEAIRWHEFGYDLETAREHAKRGESPDTVFQRRYRGGQAGITTRAASAAASVMHDGIQRFMRSGVSHEVMRGYLETHWFDDEAIAWAKEGIHAHDAHLWQEIGLVAVEAGELRKADQTPATVIRDWWRAGIPFDEVAEWIGAGLSVEETLAQRASGVTVEQAAALRALRRGGAL